MGQQIDGDVESGLQMAGFENVGDGAGGNDAALLQQAEAIGKDRGQIDIMQDGEDADAVDLLPHPSSPVPHVIWTVAENPVSQIASTP